MHTALLLIDIQNDYFDGGRNPLVNSLDAGKKISLILSHFRQTNQQRIFIQHISQDPKASFFIAESSGAEIHASITPQSDEIIFQKHFPNSFKETGLLAYLQKNNIKHLVVCGMMTHMCVDATVRAAKDFGFDCTLIYDACATKNLEIQGHLLKAEDIHNSFMAAFTSYYAKVLTVTQFLTH